MYDGLVFDLALKGEVKSQSIIPKDDTVVPKGLSITRLVESSSLVRFRRW